VPRLLRQFPNLYADLSAGSGWNALTRDRAFGIRFLVEFQDKLLFGTDVCFADAQGRMPQLGYLKALLQERQLPAAAYEKIVAGNACRLLGL
jgi:predicted TIM-barrel fold metal-dependent hydrolase